MKKIDEEKFAQRFSPRRSNSVLSQLNKERIHMLIKQRKMTAKGLTAVKHAFDASTKDSKCVVKADLPQIFERSKKTWEKLSEIS